MSCPSASSIDFASLPPSALNAAAWAAEQALERMRQDCRWQGLCADGSDEEIIAAGQTEFGGVYVPVTLANRYNYVAPCQEIVRGETGQHPRRPVVMRGAREVIIRRRSLSNSHSANGYASDIFQRVMRASKLTALTAEDYAQFADELRSRLHSRYRLTSVFRDYTGASMRDFDEGTVVIRGHWSFLSKSELANVRALQAIIQKTDRLDARLEMARKHWRERMAA